MLSNRSRTFVEDHTKGRWISGRATRPVRMSSIKPMSGAPVSRYKAVDTWPPGLDGSPERTGLPNHSPFTRSNCRSGELGHPHVTCSCHFRSKKRQDAYRSLRVASKRNADVAAMD